MRSTSLTATLALAAVLLATLTGCITDDPDLVPQPQPTTTPVFASDEEALAAAEEAYRAYLAVSDQILIDGGAEPERLLEVATQEVYEVQLEGFNLMSANSWRSTGGSIVDSLQLQSYDTSAVNGIQILTVYACVDISLVDVTDVSGASVVSPLRPDRSPFETTFDLRDEQLVISSQEIWAGDDYCAL